MMTDAQDSQKMVQILSEEQIALPQRTPKPSAPEPTPHRNHHYHHHQNEHSLSELSDFVFDGSNSLSEIKTDMNRSVRHVSWARLALFVTFYHKARRLMEERRAKAALMRFVVPRLMVWLKTTRQRKTAIQFAPNTPYPTAADVSRDPVLSQFTQQQLQLLYPDMVLAYFPPQAPIMFFNEPSTFFLILLKGSVVVQVPAGESKSQKMIAVTLKAPCVVGTTGLVTSDPRTATVRASTECVGWKVYKAPFESWCSKIQQHMNGSGGVGENNKILLSAYRSAVAIHEHNMKLVTPLTPQLLRKSSIFQPFSDEELTQYIIQEAKPKCYVRGDTIVRPVDKPSYLYVLVRGVITLKHLPFEEECFFENPSKSKGGINKNIGGSRGGPQLQSHGSGRGLRSQSPGGGDGSNPDSTENLSVEGGIHTANDTPRAVSPSQMLKNNTWRALTKELNGFGILGECVFFAEMRYPDATATTHVDTYRISRDAITNLFLSSPSLLLSTKDYLNSQRAKMLPLIEKRHVFSVVASMFTSKAKQSLRQAITAVMHTFIPRVYDKYSQIIAKGTAATHVIFIQYGVARATVDNILYGPGSVIGSTFEVYLEGHYANDVRATTHVAAWLLPEESWRSIVRETSEEDQLHFRTIQKRHYEECKKKKYTTPPPLWSGATLMSSPHSVLRQKQSYRKKKVSICFSDATSEENTSQTSTSIEPYLVVEASTKQNEQTTPPTTYTASILPVFVPDTSVAYPHSSDISMVSATSMMIPSQDADPTVRINHLPISFLRRQSRDIKPPDPLPKLVKPYVDRGPMLPMDTVVVARSRVVPHRPQLEAPPVLTQHIPERPPRKPIVFSGSHGRRGPTNHAANPTFHEQVKNAAEYALYSSDSGVQLPAIGPRFAASRFLQRTKYH